MLRYTYIACLVYTLSQKHSVCDKWKVIRNRTILVQVVSECNMLLWIYCLGKVLTNEYWHDFYLWNVLKCTVYTSNSRSEKSMNERIHNEMLYGDMIFN